MNLPAAFQGRRLRRHAWLIPFKLTFAILGVFYAALMLPDAINFPAYVLWHFPDVLFWTIQRAGPIPPAVALFFGLCALGWGLGYANSAKKALANDLGVTELAPETPLAQRVANMAKALDLPAPRVGVMRAANAYAIGSSRNDAAVVIGLPLIQSLREDELDAVIGHELGHIISGDMRRMQMAAGFQNMLDAFTGKTVEVGARSVKRSSTGLLIFAVGQLFRVTLFFVSELLVKRLSRTREYTADAFGALLTSPDAMARALKKLHEKVPGEAECSARHACLMFWNKGGRLLSTHPTLEKRLAALDRGRHLQAIVEKGCNTRNVRLTQQIGAHLRSLQALSAWSVNRRRTEMGFAVQMMGKASGTLKTVYAKRQGLLVRVPTFDEAFDVASHPLALAIGGLTMGWMFVRLLVG